ncbi:MAG: hypothetical protein IJM15_04110 [Erysipelotrichaceae bacterium]|nr:hypothetical protein [Erysipelotrichaceae bacterium]
MMKNKRIFERILTGLLAVLLSFNVFGLRIRAEEENEDKTVYGTVEWYSTKDVGATISDSFYYSDDWLLANPYERNDTLALLSEQLIAASVHEGEDEKLIAMLAQMGFEDVVYTEFRYDFDCAYTIATKTVGGVNFVIQIIQSYTFDNDIKAKGWKQNFTVNGDEIEANHYALEEAAKDALSGILSYGSPDPTRYLIIGQSRGGAIANIVAAMLPKILKAKGWHNGNTAVIGYTFEAPNIVEADDAEHYGGCGHIHNYICSDDPVTKIPMWGMVRYGVDHQLKTEETDAGLKQQLQLLGSAMADVSYSSYAGLDDLIQNLEDRVSWTPEGTQTNDRADYSKQRTDEITDANENTVTVEYNVQTAMVNLMSMIFSGAASGISLETLMENPSMLMSLLQYVIDGAKAEEAGNYNESNLQYYMGAQSLYLALAFTASEPIDLTLEDIYCLLKVLAPLLVDTSYEPEGDAMMDLLMYLSPAMDIIQNVSNITYSHHFDTIIARLKTLAPQPEFDQIDVTISEPAAGDPASKAIGEVNDFFDDLGYGWLTVRDASWNYGDEDLKEDSIAYLTITLDAVAHTVPEDFSFTVNGETPFDGPEVSYEGGIGTVTATFEFVIGTPEECTVSFTTDKGTAPEAITVRKGQSLKKVDRPEFVDTIKVDGKNWQFVDWFDENGNSWDEIAPADDIVLTAKWLQIIDKISITFTIPELGGSLSAPATPEGEGYYIGEYHFLDSSWEETDTAETAGEYYLSVFLRVDPDKAVFATKQIDEDYTEYAGKAYVNGKKVDAYYEYDGYEFVSVYFDFNVGIEPNVYSFTEGANQEWIIDSEEDAHFKVTCEGDDSEIFWIFCGLKVDGEYIEDEDFMAYEGSVEIDLLAGYLNTLEKGEHTLTAVFNDGEVTTNFTVSTGEPEENPDIPDTGDKSLKGTLALMSLSALGGICIIRRRKED